MSTMSEAVTIRPAIASDRVVLARLAALDSARPLVGDVLIAQVGDEPVAAIEIDSAKTIADPFRATADLAALLRHRVAALRCSQPRTRVRLRVRQRRFAWTTR